jgi:hypothetical protein
MYELTGSAWDLGLVGLLQFAPAWRWLLPAGPPDRPPTTAAASLALCLALQVLAWRRCCGGQRRPAVARVAAGVSVVLGAVRAFQMPAQQALTPLLVPPALLPRALAFSAAGLQGAIIAGPALGGLIYVAGAGGHLRRLRGAVCLATLLVRWAIRYEHAPPPASR